MTDSTDMPKKKAASKKTAAKKPPEKTSSKTTSAKKAAPKKATAKTAAPKKSAPKKAVAKKASPKKASTKKGAKSPTPARIISHEERWRLIAEAAYLRAEKRHFAGGGETDDWLAAEAEVDARLKREGIQVSN